LEIFHPLFLALKTRKIKQKEKRFQKIIEIYRNLLCDWKLSFTIGEEFYF